MSTEPSTDELVARMTYLLSGWEEKGDRRCVFIRCYIDETRSVMMAIQDGRFADGRWVNDLLIRFATYYLDALDAYEASASPTPVWGWAFWLAQARLTTVSEDLLLGINAHISRDLPMVLRDSLRAVNVVMSSEEQAKRLADFVVVNHLIAETAKVAEKDVLERYSHLMRVACTLCRPVVPAARWSVEEVIYSWRDQAWEAGLRLLAERDPTRVHDLEAEIEQHALDRVRIVLHGSEEEARLLHVAASGLKDLDLSHLRRHRLCDEHAVPMAGTAS